MTTLDALIGYAILALIGLAVWKSFKVRPDRSVYCDRDVKDDARTHAHVSMPTKGKPHG